MGIISWDFRKIMREMPTDSTQARKNLIMATTNPLKSSHEIELVRSQLKNLRDLCLFTMGINLAFRGGDLLSLNICDVENLEAGNDLIRREEKTNKLRRTTVNSAVVDAVQALVRQRYENGVESCDPLFIGNRGTRLTIVSLSRMWKDWGRDAGLTQNIASHSARKTKAYIMRVEHNTPIEVLCKVLNHSSPAVTMRYICVQDEEVRPFYSMEL
jgi:integrase